MTVGFQIAAALLYSGGETEGCNERPRTIMGFDERIVFYRRSGITSRDGKHNK